MSPHLSQLNVAMAHRNYFKRRNNLRFHKLATQRLKNTILGANWQLFRLERIAKCSYFILSVDTKHQVLLICNKNKEIYVANLMIQ